ncbi:hypothetical protein [Roseibacillus persicicus]|uniref:EF-Tu C-terminal domain-related protein n=1 Tax=Roseibacillus persicicus TaxID=454148 RepID=UPI00280CEFC1|nr:hypothetical protein [Roseibacillus persicicus]MDQ8192732.1 hypothetical protein [Roseibacillus persicicus]
MKQEIPYDEFKDYHLICKLYFISAEYGGRETQCFSNYRGQFFYHYNNAGTDWLARYLFAEEPVLPGMSVLEKVTLGGSVVDLAAERGMPAGRQMAIREGARVVAVGVIERSKFDYINRA